MSEPENQTMNDDFTSTQIIQRCLDEAAQGNPRAREELLNRACDRLTKLTRKLLRDFPQLRRWEQTDDVFQNATIRLCRALDDTPLTDARHFFRLAALQIRRELIDMARRYQGPQGMGAHLASQGPQGGRSQSGQMDRIEGGETTHDPQRMAEWTEFHEGVERLPDDEREVFDLLWYQELTQEEAAELLGISTRTIKRRWQSARLSLHAKLGRSPSE